MKPFLLLALLFIATLHPALAIDPGTVEGSFLVNGDTITLRHAYAHLHDNAEGLLGRPKELRILLTDREVPSDALAGIAFLPIEHMAQQGDVRGLLLELDPKDPGDVVVTLLVAPSDPARSLMTQSINTTSGNVFKDWKLGGQRVLGMIEHSDDREADFIDLPKMTFSLRFSAPIFNEPSITADLKGKEARNSPQIRVLAAKAEALARGDFETVRKLSSESANRRSEVIFTQPADEVRTFARQAGVEMRKSIRKVRRVVVRGNRAVAILSKNEWSTFVLEDGEWKSGD